MCVCVCVCLFVCLFVCINCRQPVVEENKSISAIPCSERSSI